MQYVWQHRLLMHQDLVTTDGRKVSILDPGLLNRGPGPDFFNAKVLIGDQKWAGSVEMHVRASDWHRHGHDGDAAYEGVVLHVVDSSDCTIKRPNGEEIPQLVMKCEPRFSESYDQLVQRADIDLPCAGEIKEMPEIYRQDWLTALAFERMDHKIDRIQHILSAKYGDWEETSYVTLARGMGFGTNAEPFQRLAVGTPLRFLRKHTDSPIAVEALLFGQGGLLEAMPIDEKYAVALRSEYYFYRHKFNLTPLESLGWRAGRPTNSPQRRIALLGNIITQGSGLLSRMMEVTTMTQAMELLGTPLTGYWATHYSVGVESASPLGALSRGSVELLVINVIVPLMMARGRSDGDEILTQRAMDLLHSIPGEKNHITSLFARVGLTSEDAFTSQAVIELRRSYCETRKCLYCRFGHRLLSRKARRE